jgi:hypothetical protein
MTNSALPFTVSTSGAWVFFSRVSTGAEAAEKKTDAAGGRHQRAPQRLDIVYSPSARILALWRSRKFAFLTAGRTGREILKTDR